MTATEHAARLREVAGQRLESTSRLLIAARIEPSAKVKFILMDGAKRDTDLAEYLMDVATFIEEQLK